MSVWNPAAPPPVSGWADEARPAPELAETRDLHAEFDSAGHTVSGASIERRPDAIAMDYCHALALGPDVIGETPVNRLFTRVWKARADNGTGTVWLARANDAGTAFEAETALFNYAGLPILELDVTFEQNGRAVIVAERATGAAGASEVWIYWYDPSLAAFSFEVMGAGRTPRCLLDNPLDTSDSDVLVFYVQDAADAVCYRQQRDRYAVEYTTPLTGGVLVQGEALPAIGNLFVEDVMRSPDHRLVVLVSARENGRYRYAQLASTLYPYLPNPSQITSDNPALISGGEEIVLILIEAPGSESTQYPNVFAMPDESSMTTPNAALLSGQFDIVMTIIDVGIDPATTHLDADPMKAPNPTLQSGTNAATVIIWDETAHADSNMTGVNPTLQSGSIVTYVIVADETAYPNGLTPTNPALQSGTLA